MQKLSIAFVISSILLLGCQSKTLINWVPLAEQSSDDISILIDPASLSMAAHNPNLRSANLLYNINGHMVTVLPYQSSIVEITINCIDKTFISHQTNYVQPNAQGNPIGTIDQTEFTELAFPQDMAVYQAICQ